MKLSVNTWVYGANTDIEQIFRKVKEQHYTGVEMYGREEDVTMSNEEAAKIKMLAKSYGIELVSCCADTGMLNPAYKRNLCSMNPELRQRAIEHCIRGIDHTVRIGAKLVVLCVGKLEKGQTEEQAFKLAVESYKELVKYAKKKDVIIIIENFPDRWIGSVQKLKELCERIGEPDYCKGMIDTGHELIMGNTLEKAVHVLGNKYMGHLHLDNNNGVVDHHNAMGIGKLTDDDFRRLARVLKDIGYNGWYSFELYGEDYMDRNGDEVLNNSRECFKRTMAPIIGE